MKITAKVVGKRKIRDDERVFLDHVRLRGENYSNRKLGVFCTVGCTLECCNLQGIRIQDAQFGAGREVSEFIECIFDDAKMDHISGGPSRFVRCSFRNVKLKHWIGRAVELIDCSFSGRLHTAVFNGIVPEEVQADIARERNEFYGNDFSKMEFIDVGFRTGVDLSKQHLPEGPDYLYLPDAESAVRRARLAALGWKNPELRQFVMMSTKHLEGTIAGGQKQLLLRKSDEYLYASPPREAVDVFYALLRGDDVSP